MLHSIKALVLRLLSGAILTTGFISSSMAEISGFQEQYVANVGGATWGLKLEKSKTFVGFIIGHLNMGDINNRLVLMGSPSDNTLSGTYKPFFQIGSGNKAFTLARQDGKTALLKLEDLPGYPAEGITFKADSHSATLDQSLIGTWRTEPEFGLRSNEPYTAGQWVIEFRKDGTLCRHQFFIDTRRNDPTGSPCSVADSQRWKIEQNKILLNTGYSSEWELGFNYRIMSGHLFISYPNQSHRHVFSKDEESFASH